LKGGERKRKRKIREAEGGRKVKRAKKGPTAEGVGKKGGETEAPTPPNATAESPTERELDKGTKKKFF